MILNATEANRKSTMVKRERHDKEMKEVKKAIGDAIGNGEFDATLWYSISSDMTRELERAGYLVEESSGGMNERKTIIRW